MQHVAPRWHKLLIIQVTTFFNLHCDIVMYHVVREMSVLFGHSAIMNKDGEL